MEILFRKLFKREGIKNSNDIEKICGNCSFFQPYSNNLSAEEYEKIWGGSTDGYAAYSIDKYKHPETQGSITCGDDPFNSWTRPENIMKTHPCHIGRFLYKNPKP